TSRIRTRTATPVWPREAPAPRDRWRSARAARGREGAPANRRKSSAWPGASAPAARPAKRTRAGTTGPGRTARSHPGAAAEAALPPAWRAIQREGRQSPEDDRGPPCGILRWYRNRETSGPRAARLSGPLRCGLRVTRVGRDGQCFEAGAAARADRKSVV